MNYEDGVKFLKAVKRYLKPGGILIAATLLDEQLEHSIFSSYLITEISGWNLDYKHKGVLKTMFQEAGYEWIQSFSDYPTNFYDIDVGRVPAK